MDGDRKPGEETPARNSEREQPSAIIDWNAALERADGDAELLLVMLEAMQEESPERMRSACGAL